MKIQFFENENGVAIEFKPETPEEVAQLARIALNRSSEAPDIKLFLSGSPSANIWIKKVKPVAQKHCISRTKI